MSPQTQTRQRTGTRTKAAGKARAKRGRSAAKAQAKRGRPASKVQAKRGQPAGKARAKRGRPAAKAQAKRGRPAGRVQAKPNSKGETMRRGRPRGRRSILQQAATRIDWVTTSCWTLLQILHDGEASQTDLITELKISPQAVAKQISELRKAGVLSERIEGRSRVYSLNGEGQRLCTLGECIQQHWTEQESAQQESAQQDSSLTTSP